MPITSVFTAPVEAGTSSFRIAQTGESEERAESVWMGEPCSTGPTSAGLLAGSKVKRKPPARSGVEQPVPRILGCRSRLVVHEAADLRANHYVRNVRRGMIEEDHSSVGPMKSAEDPIPRPPGGL